MSTSSRSRHGAGGFSLVELLVTIVLAGIVFAAMVPVFVGAQQKASGDQMRNVALNAAQDHIEKIREMPFSGIVSGPNLDTTLGTTWSSYGGSSSKLFHIQHTVVPGPGSPVTYFTVSVRVWWDPPPAPVKEVLVTTIIVDGAVAAVTPSQSPTITNFTPASGSAGTSVTITGTNFTGATTVAFNGTAATIFTVDSATQITVTVPSGATSGTIAVTTPAGTGASSASFTVGVTSPSTPTVTSFTPTSGPVGTSVTLTGTNFTGATKVAFNGTSAPTYTVVSATQITVTVPSGATSGTIAVTTSVGTGASTASFTVSATTYPNKRYDLTAATNEWYNHKVHLVQTNVVPTVDWGTKTFNGNTAATWKNLPSGAYRVEHTYGWWDYRTEVSTIDLLSNLTLRYDNYLTIDPGH